MRHETSKYQQPKSFIPHHSTMLRIAISFLALCFTALALPTLEVPAEPSAAAPAGFNISSFGIIGTGCPPGTVYYALNGEKTAVTVTFSQFFAEASPSTPMSANRKACQMTFGLNVPPGFTFGIANVDSRGYYQLDNAVTALQRSVYYFQGELVQAEARQTFTGPIDGKQYTHRTPFDLATTVLSPCGKNSILAINSDIRVSNSANRQGSGYIATDSVDTSFVTTFNFQWQKC